MIFECTIPTSLDSPSIESLKIYVLKFKDLAKLLVRSRDIFGVAIIWNSLLFVKNFGGE